MKLKNRKSAFKRVIAKKKCFFRKCAYKSHLLKHKTSKRLRRLSVAMKIHASDEKNFYLMVPYIL